MAYTKSRVRIGFDTASREPAVDVITGKAPVIWNGNDVQFEIAGFFNGAPIDVSEVEQLTLEIKPYPAITGAALFAGTISGAGAAITLDNWNNGSAQQFTASMPASTDFGLAGAMSRVCWLVVRADCGATAFTLGATQITIMEDGH